jgi:hypothetical protein
MHPFDRFTPNAKLALQIAEQEAKNLKSPYIGTEHLLLGLLSIPKVSRIFHLHRSGRDAGERPHPPQGNEVLESRGPAREARTLDLPPHRHRTERRHGAQVPPRQRRHGAPAPLPRLHGQERRDPHPREHAGGSGGPASASRGNVRTDQSPSSSRTATWSNRSKRSSTVCRARSWACSRRE